MMLVGDDPSSINFTQADRQAKIQGLLLTATHRGNDKGNITARSDRHVRNVEGNRIGRPSKE